MSEHEWKASVRDEAARERGYPIALHGPTVDYGISMRSAWGLYESLRDALTAAGIKPPEPQARTVPVRIAVAVDDAGFHRIGLNRTEAVECYADHNGPSSRPLHVVWVTASVPLPQSVEVKGEVKA